MTTPYDPIIKKIIDGWPVDAAHTNLPIEGLERRTQYLKEFLELVRAGEALIMTDVTLEETTTWLGSPVYWNSGNSRYEGAKASFNFSAGVDYGIPNAEALVRGIVINKISGTRGDVILCGIWRDADLTAVLASPAVGTIYLSPSENGKITQSNVPGRIPIGYYDGTNVFVDKAELNSVNDHVHFRFELVTDPASSNSGAAKLSLTGGKYTIVAPDTSEQGWLPASDPSFGGLAPSGAKFGYNLAQHPELQEIWPPAPVTAASIELTNGAPPEASIVPEGVIEIDENGLWWMDDCQTQCPWESPYPDPAPDPNLCTHERKMVLWFTKFSHLTAQSMVQSLTTCDASPVQIEVRKCLTGEAGTTGQLCLYLDSVINYDPTAPADPAVAIKEIVGADYRVGPVASSVRSVSPRLQVSGVDIGGKYAGDITLTLDEVSGSITDVPELVALDNSRQEIIQDCSYLEFPASYDSSAIYKIALPPALNEVNIKLVVWMLATSVDANVPSLDVAYRVFQTPSGVVSLSSTLNTLAGGLSWPFGTVSVANQYTKVESAEIVADGGDIILFKVSRTTGGYAGNVGLLKVYYQTSAV